MNNKNSDDISKHNYNEITPKIPLMKLNRGVSSVMILNSELCIGPSKDITPRVKKFSCVKLNMNSSNVNEDYYDPDDLNEETTSHLKVSAKKFNNISKTLTSIGSDYIKKSGINAILRESMSANYKKSKNMINNKKQIRAIFAQKKLMKALFE